MNNLISDLFTLKVEYYQVTSTGQIKIIIVRYL